MWIEGPVFSHEYSHLFKRLPICVEVKLNVQENVIMQDAFPSLLHDGLRTSPTSA